MRIRFGCTLGVRVDGPAIAMLMVEPELSRTDALQSFAFKADGRDPGDTCIDSYGNVVRRIQLTAGTHQFECDGTIYDSGLPETYDSTSLVSDIVALPGETITFLKPSRYCESDLLAEFAWPTFGHLPLGHDRVQAICDFVHGHLTFGYAHAALSRTAFSAMQERVGVCRDFAHLAVALCRAVNVPARYACGYLGDIGVPKDPAPMDFSAWFEAFIGGRWWTYDARHNTPRTGRIVTARGRDAVDTPIITTFGTHELVEFKVWTDELPANVMRAA